MYTQEALEAIRRYETMMFGGDSDFRHDSREAFYNAHQSNWPVRMTGPAIYVIVKSPDGNAFHYFPPGTKAADVIWETDPTTNTWRSYIPKALPARTVKAE